MVQADSDIYNPVDFKGKRVSHLGVAELMLMLEQAGVSKDDVSLYAGFEPIADFKAGKFDALQVYTSNEPFEMQQQGIEIRQICPKQYGLNLYADILFTSENVLLHRPELVEKFKQASLQGWRYAMLHLQESIEVTHRKYATHKSVEQIAYEAEKLRPYIAPPGVTIGNMSDLHWRWIGQIYGLDMAQYDAVRDRFIYKLKLPENILPWSWMLIAACALTLFSIPLYLHLIFNKKRRYKLNESAQENENEVE
jgi:ABC-type nitrate/sulfonate/bicarbonate transport system substrate-binding protein